MIQRYINRTFLIPTRELRTGFVKESPKPFLNILFTRTLQRGFDPCENKMLSRERFKLDLECI